MAQSNLHSQYESVNPSKPEDVLETLKEQSCRNCLMMVMDCQIRREEGAFSIGNMFLKFL